MSQYNVLKNEEWKFNTERASLERIRHQNLVFSSSLAQPLQLPNLKQTLSDFIKQKSFLLLECYLLDKLFQASNEFWH